MRSLSRSQTRARLARALVQVIFGQINKMLEGAILYGGSVFKPPYTPCLYCQEEEENECTSLL